MPIARSMLWWHADGGVLPQAVADPWILTGTGASLANGALRLVDSSGAARLTYLHKLVSSDGPTAAPRQRDWVWFQLSVRGVSATPAWASGASPIGFFIDDGARAMAVSIGSSLQLIDPVTGDVVATVAASFSWLVEHVYLLLKTGSDRWVLHVDGKKVAEVAYTAAAVSPGGPARVVVGSMDVGGTSTCYVNQLEVGLNQAVPPQWKVDRAYYGFPVAIQNRWTTMARAALRATVGLLETPIRMLEEAWRDLTAARLAESAYSFAGDVMPDDVIPAWTLVNGGDLSIERGRLRIDAAGVTTTGVSVLAPVAATGLPVDVEYCFGATWTVPEYTADAAGRVGPYMRITNGDAHVVVQLVEVVAGESWAWVFTDDAITGAYTEIGTIQWQVDIRQAVDVEVLVLGQQWVLLLINRQIVDRVPYASFDSGSADPGFELGSASAGAGAVGVYLVEHVIAERRLCDLARRPLLLQGAVERAIPVGGCERNDELETWMQHHIEVQQLRGTRQGILVEVKRLACTEDCYVVRNTDYAGWYLDVSYPEVTPIWLDAEGVLSDVFVEFGVGSVNFSPQALADLAAWYLVPRSTPELEYFVCLAARLTIDSTVPAPGRTRVTVVSTEGFTVGDAVTIRTSDNVVLEDHVVVAVISGVALDIDETTLAPFPAGSVIRKVLATT